MFKTIAAAAALAASGMAHGASMNFSESYDVPFIYAGDRVHSGGMYLEAYGGPFVGDMVGAIVDGTDNGACFEVQCPVNNPGQYYAGLADSYFYIGMDDDSLFRLASLRASFIGAGQTAFNAVRSGVLVLQGYNASDVAIGAAAQLNLGGPTGGQFNFSTYNLSSMAGLNYSYIRVLGYACDASGNNCNRTSNLANFAIDDISTIPEPTSIALFGLGALGMAAFKRRRRAA